MLPRADQPLAFQVLPLTPDRWTDLEALFGPRGACGGCWCMYWRQTRSEYERFKGEANRLALQVLVKSGEIPGLIAYAQSSAEAAPPLPVGWISVGPRAAFSTLQRSRILKPVDDRSVWSIVCFFIKKRFRRQGLTAQLIRAALLYAGSHGAQIVEAYPVEPRTGIVPDVFAYTGFPGPFIKSGFIEVARRSETRPVMRYFFGEQK